MFCHSPVALKKVLLIWMLYSRTMNNKINCLHERSLRIAYSNQSSTFEKLLKGDKTFSIHRKNIQNLSIEIYNFLNGLSSDMINSVFYLKKRTDLVWEIRMNTSIYSFKTNIRKWKPDYPCRLCKKFVTYWIPLKINIIYSVTQPYVKSPIQSLFKPLGWSLLSA